MASRNCFHIFVSSACAEIIYNNQSVAREFSMTINHYRKLSQWNVTAASCISILYTSAKFCSSQHFVEFNTKYLEWLKASKQPTFSIAFWNDAAVVFHVSLHDRRL
jgi:hypothetical protein